MAFVVEQPSFARKATAIAGERAVGADDTMERYYDRDRVRSVAAPTARLAAGQANIFANQ
jgi:hypothetical protein